jgi:hypothetical protein
MYIRALLSFPLVAILLLAQPLISASQVYALVKSCFHTAIGPNAPKNFTFPPGCQSGGGTTGPCGSVIDWAQKLNDSLVIGESGFDKLTAPFSSCDYSAADSTRSFVHYWCTFLVADSYNLAGIKGLSITAHAGVVGMHDFMDSNPNYQFIDYRTDKQGALAKVKPGFNFYIERTFKVHTSQHTGLIKTITLDDRGNGEIITLEANAGKKTKTWTVANWIIKTGDSRPLVGFGGPK